MQIEIERKFLTVSEDWRNSCIRSVHLRDGLVAAEGGRKVRVRIADNTAFLTIKGARVGLARDEFEYPIPLADAEHMLAQTCQGVVVTKTRHYVLEQGFTFEVDVYGGLLAGITIAEAELNHPDQTFPRPPWLGDEITGRDDYRKITLLRSRLAEISGNNCK